MSDSGPQYQSWEFAKFARELRTPWPTEGYSGMAQHTNRRLEELTRATSNVTPHQNTVADAQQPADIGNSGKKYQRCYRTTKANSTTALWHLLYAAERAKCWTGGRNKIAWKQNFVWAYVKVHWGSNPTPLRSPVRRIGETYDSWGQPARWRPSGLWMIWRQTKESLSRPVNDKHLLLTFRYRRVPPERAAGDPERYDETSHMHEDAWHFVTVLNW